MIKSNDIAERSLIIIGCGAYGRLMLEVAKQMGNFECVGFIGQNATIRNHKVSGLPILGNDTYISKLTEMGINAAVIGVGSIERRSKLIDLVVAEKITIPTIIDPTSVIYESANIGSGVSILACATVSSEVKIGSNTVIGTGVKILHNAEIGVNTIIGGGSTIGANARIGNMVKMGVGVVVASQANISIGNGSEISAGSVILKDIPDHSFAIGNPARLIPKK